MASVYRVVSNICLCRKNFLQKQIIHKIQRHKSVTLREQLNDQADAILKTLSPLLNANDLSQDLCLHVRNEMINKHVIPEQNVDTRILDLCLKENKFQIAKAYINCLENNGYSINVYALVRFLQSCYLEKPKSRSEENDIINMVEKIIKQWEHKPPTVIKSCITALCQTYKWDMSLELLKDEDIWKELHTVIAPHVIPAAFRNGEVDVGLRLLDELDDPQNDGHKHSLMYIEFLNYYLQSKPEELNAAVEKIFSYWRKYDIVPTKHIIDHFVNACSNAGWVTEYVKIERDGYCSHCGNQLSAFALNNKTFKKLAKNIISETLIDKDIFQNTTPIELNKFKNFINKTKPYDIVIDGLNVSCGRYNTKWLRDIIKYFSLDNKKILIIARTHMYRATKWVLPLKNVYIYFFDDITTDDPYILYATLVSGSNAKFVTYDLLRQHVHKLKDKNTRRSFKRWQYTHQYSWSYDDSSKKVSLTEPWLCEPFAQYNNGSWHIPYRMDSEKFKLLYKPVDTWICFRKPQK